MTQSVSSFTEDPIYVAIELPSQIQSSGLDFQAWIVVIIIIILLMCWVLGIIVEFTSLCNHERITVNDQEKLKIEDCKTKCGLFFYSFSPVNNIKKLFTINKSGDQSLTVLNGIRVISMCWVIIGHSFNFILLVPTVNSANLPLMFNSILFGIVPAGVYAVDIFFFLSGLLTCYLLILKMYPKKGSINFLLVYFHRYYRLIFPLLFVQGLSMCLIRYLGDGPIYRQSWDSLLKKQCEKYWWSHLFFINNLIPWKTSDECIVWAWYLANDFEFFLITPPILYLFCKSRISGYIAIYVLLIATMLSNAIIYGYYNISPAGKSEEIDFQNFIYIKPWVRIGPYLIGILFGLGVFELKMKEKYHELKDTFFNSFFEKLCNSRTLSASSAVIGTLLMILCCLPIGYVYANCLQTNCLSRLSSALFGMLSRSLFVIGLGLIIAPTIVGRLRFLIYFLGSETFAVLARLNYAVYLMHVVVMLCVMYDTRQGMHASLLYQWIFGLGSIVVSYVVAIPVTMICEVPFMNLEKYNTYTLSLYSFFPQKQCDQTKKVKTE